MHTEVTMAAVAAGEAEDEDLLIGADHSLHSAHGRTASGCYLLSCCGRHE